VEERSDEREEKQAYSQLRQKKKPRNFVRGISGSYINSEELTIVRVAERISEWAVLLNFFYSYWP